MGSGSLCPVGLKAELILNIKISSQPRALEYSRQVAESLRIDHPKVARLV